MPAYLDRPQVVFSTDGWVVFVERRDRVAYLSSDVGLSVECDLGDLDTPVFRDRVTVTRGATPSDHESSAILDRIVSALILMGGRAHVA